MRLFRRREPESRSDGCGFLLLTCVFTCFFLVLNSVLVSSTYPLLENNGPPLFSQDKVTQVVLFVGPVLLLFLEWWIVDKVVYLFSLLRRDGWRDNNEP